MIDFCENGAKAVADEATCRQIGAQFFSQYSLVVLREKSGRWLNDQGRLAEPMVRLGGATHYSPIDWNDAYKLIATELKALASPNEAVFYTSGRTSNEAAFLYQLFVRKFGTNNLPDSSNLCHESSGRALKETLGSGKGTVTLEDFEVPPKSTFRNWEGSNKPSRPRAASPSATRSCANTCWAIFVRSFRMKREEHA